MELRNLMLRIAARDRQAFDCLYRLTSVRLYQVALRILRRPALAEEVLQETYISVWQRSELYDPNKSQPLTWLCTITRNRALDVYRKERAAPQEQSSDSIENYPDTREAISRVNRMLYLDAPIKKLHDRQRQVLLLAFYEGLTHAELARHFKQPLGTIKSWLRRSLITLRGELQ